MELCETFVDMQKLFRMFAKHCFLHVPIWSELDKFCPFSLLLKWHRTAILTNC